MGMKRVVMVVVTIAALGAIGFAVRRHTIGLRAEKQREARYQAALLSNTNALKPGMKRLEVEDYLRARGAEFHQMCCVEAPRVCNGHSVHVAFEFEDSGEHESIFYEAHPEDTLKAIAIYHQLEGCL